MFGARVQTKDLAQLCRRLATGLEAGIDVRKVWSREVEGRSSAGLRMRLAGVREAVAAGRCLIGIFHDEDVRDAVATRILTLQSATAATPMATVLPN